MEYLQYIEEITTVEENLGVLNLVINGIPSILEYIRRRWDLHGKVLNLVINGIPSIQSEENVVFINIYVLNLVINGIPSIQNF